MSDAKDHLFHLRTDPERPLEHRDQCLVTRTEDGVYGLAGGLPVRGFFVVDRGILPALLGHILTYLIILIQFRADGGTPEPAEQSTNATTS